MTACTHRQLVLLPEKHIRMRCRHCHLTIKAEDLTSRYCPECFETTKTKRYDFEEIVSLATGITRYRCEECGGIIESR
jgi:Zn finger protein HypA/HybF involved in hydrogenase expression